MMGKDCERMFNYINQIKDAASSSVIALSNATAYQITCSAEHAGTAFGHCTPYETKVPVSASTFTNPITSIMNSFKDDCSKMQTLESGLFTDPSSFNNSYGSPWKEIHKLEEAIDAMKNYASVHPSLNYVGEKDGLLAIINLVVSLSIDLKWALAKYHDYVQRGYDTIFNGNKPSVTHKRNKNKKSIGNVKQKYDDNVNIEEEPEEVF